MFLVLIFRGGEGGGGGLLEPQEEETKKVMKIANFIVGFFVVFCS